MSQILTGIHPTRMELLALRKRKQIAERGGDLLREKLDALMIEFFQFVREISGLRLRSQQLLSDAYSRFSESQVSLGFRKLEEASVGVDDRFLLDTKSRNVIGVAIPFVQIDVEAIDGFPYDMLETSAKLDEATAKMVDAVKAVAELSSSQAAITKLAQAIASTKRRVNCLEFIIIPRMLNTIRYIEMHLQEREREDFFRLKRIKRRLEEEKRAAVAS
jgi:V/A-type H+-transporting ATPase subunit D